MRGGPFFIVRRRGIGLVTDQREDTRGLGLALDLNQVELEGREVGYVFPRRLADDDAGIVGARLPLKPRGEVDRVADGRIGETLFRAHVADARRAAVDPDPRLEQQWRL